VTAVLYIVPERKELETKTKSPLLIRLEIPLPHILERKRKINLVNDKNK
jgi:hypothetical protein